MRFGLRNITTRALRVRSNGPLIVCLLSVALLLVICSRWYSPGTIIAQGDTFFGFDPLNQLRKSIFAWNHLNGFFGQPDSGAAWTVWLLLSGGLTSLIGSAYAQIVMLWTIMAMGWTAMFNLARALRCSLTASALAAWAFTINPWTQSFMSNGGTPPFTWLTGLLCWYVVVMVIAARMPRTRNRMTAVVCFLTFGPLCIVGANPALIATFLLGTVAAVGLARIYAADKREYFVWLLRTAALALICAAWWIFPLINLYTSARLAATTTISAGDWSWVVSRASFLNLLRLNPLWTWNHPEYFPYADAYDSNVFVYAGGFLLSVGLAVSILTARGRRARAARWCVIVGTAMLFLAKGLHPPLAWLNGLLYYLPGMFLFREPTTKFPIIAIIFMAVAFAFAVDGTRSRLRLKSRPRLAAGLALGAAIEIALSGNALLTGAINHGNTPNYHANVPGLPPTHIRLPDYWKNAIAYLNSGQDSGGVLALPRDEYYQVSYDWGYYGADFLTNWSVRRRVMLLSTAGYAEFPEIVSAQKWIARAINSGSSLAIPALRDVGIRFVFYRGDIVNGAEHTSLARLDRLFGSARRLAFGPLVVWDLGSTNRAAVAADWIDGQYDGRIASFLDLRALGEHVPRFDISAPPPFVDRAPALFEQTVTPTGTDPLTPPDLSAVLYDRISRGLPSDSASMVYQGTATLNDDSAALAASAPRRLIAHGDSGDSAGIAFSPAKQYQLKVSLLGEPRHWSVVRIPVSQIPPSITDDATTLISGDVYAVAPDREVIDLTNPTDRPATIDFSIALAPSRKQIYLLEGPDGLYSSSVSAARTVSWITFRTVRLRPGPNHFLISSPERLHPNRTTVPTSEQRLRIGMIRIERSRYSDVIPRQGRASEVQIDQGTPSVRVATLPLNVPLIEEPLAMVWGRSAVSDVELGALIDATINHATYRCYVAIKQNVPFSLRDSVELCLERADIGLTGADATVTSMTLVASIPSTVTSVATDSLASLDLCFLEPQRRAEDVSLEDAALHTEDPTVRFQVLGATELHLTRESKVSPHAMVGGDATVLTQGNREVTGRIIQIKANNIAEIELRDGSAIWIPLTSINTIRPRAGTEAANSRVELAWPKKGSDSGSLLAIIARFNGGLSGRGFEVESQPGAVRLDDATQEAYGVINYKQREAHPNLRIFLNTRDLIDVGKVQFDFVTIPVRTLAPAQIKVNQRMVRYSVDAGAVGTSDVFREPLPPLVAFSKSDYQLSTMTLGPNATGARSEAPVDLERDLDGLMVANVSVSNQLLLVNELYSKAWIALGPNGLAPHFLADGWRNAWYVQRPGTIVMINLMVVVQLVFFLSGLLTMTLTARRS